ncbi:MAG: GNAT family N-acetyltransferase [Anaerolineae bacterium]
MSDTQIYLKPVTAENWKACTALELAPDQKGFVPSNLYSIAESQFYAGARSQAIYNLDDQVIGYALWGRDVFTNKWKVFRIMIDQAHQHKGFGKAAMQMIIEQIAMEPDGREILICYQNENEVARKLYTRLGFIEQEVDEAGKVTALFTLKSKT